ncbi:hypothetical protein MJO29_009237 [Puccinia striiformis f. sp. tritici]|nr:hypothetical protein MJO29_009237 [Puccinia striiformis f. sp. tritici]
MFCLLPTVRYAHARRGITIQTNLIFPADGIRANNYNQRLRNGASEWQDAQWKLADFYLIRFGRAGGTGRRGEWVCDYRKIGHSEDVSRTCPQAPVSDRSARP